MTVRLVQGSPAECVVAPWETFECLRLHEQEADGIAGHEVKLPGQWATPLQGPQQAGVIGAMPREKPEQPRLASGKPRVQPLVLLRPQLPQAPPQAPPQARRVRGPASPKSLRGVMLEVKRRAVLLLRVRVSARARRWTYKRQPLTLLLPKAGTRSSC